MYRIDDYQNKPAFSSFLPGIAGFRGIPAWVFYCNRGQGITSFGLGGKDGAILEFQPSVKAYSLVHTQGFRTFVRSQTEDFPAFEAFAYPGDQPEPGLKQYQEITEDQVAFGETRPGLKIIVRYSILYGQPLGALIRTLEIQNTSAKSFELEILDGLPRLVPFGSTDDGIKNIATTLTGWMVSETFEGRGLYARMSSTFADSTQVREQRGGNWVLSWVEGDARVLPLVYDPNHIFGADISFAFPGWFRSKGLGALKLDGQVAVGRFPCAFTPIRWTLAPGESRTLTTLVGSAPNTDAVLASMTYLTSPGFIAKNRQDGRDFLDLLLEPGRVSTGSADFDAYTTQTYLDNLLRGGFPWIVSTAEGDRPYHLFGRKHGDMERDYNQFSLRPEFYSRGPGNFRDVFQNRRTELWYEPRVGASGIREFMNLLQADGYNPLVVQGIQFETPGEQELKSLGALAQQYSLETLPSVLSRSRAIPSASFGEGYWIDHWTYGLDLIDEYLGMYPEKASYLFFEDRGYTWYSGEARVLPRHRRYVVDGNEVYQYHGIEENENHTTPKKADESQKPLSTLFEKLVLLAALKYTTLDAQGIGIEMEAGKPGWYDALNGLPARFGSSTSELAELYRLVKILRIQWQNLAEDRKPEACQVPPEALSLFTQPPDLYQQFKAGRISRFEYWETLNDLREAYRDHIYFVESKDRVELPQSLSVEVLEKWLAVVSEDLEEAVHRWEVSGKGDLPPTYYQARATKWSATAAVEKAGIRVESLEYSPLPAFLEGAVKFIKIFPQRAEEIRNKVRASGLFDSKLAMYKVNESLDSLPLQIGRARAFPAGWLENESIWLHMEYKFLLELLKAGRADLFWEDAKTCLIPFLDPQVYGRSIYENSSFIVSSAHPDRRLWGRGFVARLSGSTAEFLHLVKLALWGLQPFGINEGTLTLGFVPLLPGWLFREDGSMEGVFLGGTRVRYINLKREDLYGDRMPLEYVVAWKGRETQVFRGAQIRGRAAEAIRAGLAEKIEVRF